MNDFLVLTVGQLSMVTSTTDQLILLLKIKTLIVTMTATETSIFPSSIATMLTL